MHKSFPPHINEVLRGKNILLWERLLKAYDYPDMDVVHFMKEGVELVGEHTTSPIYPQQRVGATTSVELLKKSAVCRNKSFAATPVHAQDPELTAKLWDVTMSEVDKGFLKGPYSSLDEVRRITGADEILVNRRFLLLQGESSGQSMIAKLVASMVPMFRQTSWCCRILIVLYRYAPLQVDVLRANGLK